MRIQNQIFLTILLIFTCVFGLATWLYYIHFEQSLNRAESEQAAQINRYVDQEINGLLQSHQRIMDQLNQDGDVTSAYDRVNWVAFMGRKFISKTAQNLFERYPYLQQIAFERASEPFITLTAPGKKLHSTAWINQSRPLDVAMGRLTLSSDILAAMQNHLKANNISKSTKLYFEKDNNAWLISDQKIERLASPLYLDQNHQVWISRSRYLSSPALGKDTWSVQSLISLQQTKLALEELLIQAVMAYLLSAILFFVIARYLSHKMIRPLHRLEKAAISVMGGTYSPIDMDMTSDETLPAIEAFNSMSKRIQGFTQELQDQVAARTKELEIANAELALMNETDILTGARSRQFLTHHASNLISLAHRSKLSLGIAMLDIDYFKKINDTFGHVKGDECLIAFVDTLHKSFRRDNDWVIRYGGEEFCLICFGLDHQDFHKHLEEFRKMVGNIQLESDMGEKINFTVSIGYTHYPCAPQQWSDPLIGRADELLYKAKHAGRNRIMGEELQA